MRSARLLIAFCLTPMMLLIPHIASATCYAPGDAYPSVQGTTHIESISPQFGLAGVTEV